MANKTVIIKIKRQLAPDAKPAWEEFEVPDRPGMNVTSALMEIAANPVTRNGKQTTPVTYDANCLEEICGSCAMLINGRAQMACSSLLYKFDQPIKIEPRLLQMRADAKVSAEQLKNIRLTGAQDLVWALVNNPAFLFNH